MTASERAKSLTKLLMRLTLTPGAGWISKRVTTGPGKTCLTSALMPKSANFDSSRPDNWLNCSCEKPIWRPALGSSSRSKWGTSITSPGFLTWVIDFLTVADTFLFLAELPVLLDVALGMIDSAETFIWVIKLATDSSSLILGCTFAAVIMGGVTVCCLIRWAWRAASSRRSFHSTHRIISWSTPRKVDSPIRSIKESHEIWANNVNPNSVIDSINKAVPAG